MDIDMDRTYTVGEIEALDLPEYTVLADKDNDTWVQRNGVFLCGDNGDLWNYEPLQILHVPVVESPPKVDWATPRTKWFRTWVAVEPDPDSVNGDYIVIRREGSPRWDRWHRLDFSKIHNIPVDQLPPHQPAWPSPHGVTIEQAREIAAALEQFESES